LGPHLRATTLKLAPPYFELIRWVPVGKCLLTPDGSLLDIRHPSFALPENAEPFMLMKFDRFMSNLKARENRFSHTHYHTIDPTMQDPWGVNRKHFYAGFMSHN